MPTVGSMLSNIRVIVGDPDRDFLSDAIGLDWVNQAQRRFSHKVLALDEIKDFTVTQYVPRFDVPTDTIIPLWAKWYKSRTAKLEYKPPDRFEKIMEGWPNANGTPDIYTFFRRQVVVGPQRPSTTSATALASGAMSSTVTTLNLTAASGTFRSKGWGIIDSEVFEYTGVATSTLTGVTRGVHGTNNTSHSSGTQLTEIDLQMGYRKTPAALTATTASPEIPVAFHDYLEKYVLYLAWLARGDSAKAQVALMEFDGYEKECIKTVGRRAQDGLMAINERWRARWY